MDEKEGFLLIGTTMIILSALVLSVLAVMLIYRKRRLDNEREKKLLNEKHEKEMMEKQLELLKQQLEKQKAIEQIRSKISSDIHDEIGSQLTKISLMSQRMKMNFQSKKEVDPTLADKITASSKEIVANLGEIIWTVNPKHDNLVSLLAYIRNYAAHFFDDTGIAYSIEFPENISHVNIHPDVKRNLFLVIKESLNNILKHAQATQVHIKFQCNETHYAFTITDNGKGIDPASQSAFGNGLINMKNRMQAVSGTFQLVSEKNTGTEIQLEGSFEC